MAQIKPSAGVDDRIPLADALPLASPFTLNVFPTNACNFKCSYCAHSLSDDELAKIYNLDKSIMSLETMEAIIEQSKAFPSPYKLLSFMGHGEPLLNRNLPKMIEMVKKSGIAKRIEIITNASVLNTVLSDQLIEAGLTNLRISLQGLNSESYRNTCGVFLDFEQFLEHIAYFYRQKSDQMGLFVKIMNVSLKPNDEQRFYDMFGDICDRMYVEHVQPVYHAVSVQEDKSDIRYDRYGNAHLPRQVCPLAFFSFGVWPNGDVQPCDAIYKPCLLGNVNASTLKEMWQGDNLKQFRIQHLSGNKNFIQGCADCCAPDDVSHPLDTLDDRKEELLKRMCQN